MSIHKTEAFVLRRFDFRETSLIVDFYTRDFGKVSGILKGIRTDFGKFASTVQLFSYNDIVFYRKRDASLHLVSQADIKDNFDFVRGDMLRAGMASLMMELVAAVMALEDKNEEVFNLCLTCLLELKRNPQPEKVLTIFKIKILSLSGFKPHFDSCVSCAAKIHDQSKFSLTSGGLLCPKCFHKDSAGRTIFRGTSATILHIEKNDFFKNLNLGFNPQIKRELDIILNAFLHFHLDKEMKSQRVLRTLEQPFLPV